jgi:hypothetical protein
MYSLADLTRMSGAKRRTVQLWAEGGVLVAEPATERQGSGVHRAFSRNEAIIVLILSRLTAVSPPIGRLRFIAGRIRKHLKANDWGKELIEDTIRGECSAFLSVYFDGQVALSRNEKFSRNATIDALSECNEAVVVVLLDIALSALRSV